jgi:hypothetical protein
MRRMVRPLVVAVMVALVALVGPGVQAAAPPQVQHFTVDNEFDPELTAQLSATCGFPVDATVSGRLSEIVRTTDSGVLREVVIQSVLITFTNPATGESVTLRNEFQPKLTATPTSTTTAHVVLVRTGLNFLYLTEDGAQASAGRQMLVLEVTFDAQGNIISVVPTLDTRTPNLVGIGTVVCPALAA